MVLLGKFFWLRRCLFAFSLTLGVSILKRWLRYCK